MTKLIIGCGYLGRRVATAWIAAGHEVFALTRSESKAEELRSAGILAVVGDLAAAGSLRSLPPAETVLHAVGFDRSAGQSIEQVYVEGLANVLNVVDSASLEKFFFISSTGVYGQHDGSWVDEQSECAPRRAGGRACLEAEKTLGAHSVGESAIILRLAGLYGPGRIPRRRELSAGGLLSIPTRGFLNLIHVEDVVRVILAAEQKVIPPELFVVADGHPAQRSEYYRELARLLSAPEPRFGPPSKSSPATARAAGSDKRVSSQRIREQLGVDLQYPSFREGLAGILHEEMRGEAGGK